MRKLLQNKLFWAIFIIIVWRISVLVIPLAVASQVNKNLQPTLENWNRWDAPHYLYIAKNGYTSQGDAANFIVFPPLYPFVVKALDTVFNDLPKTALITSNILFIGATIIFYILIKENYGKNTAQKACIFLNIFPTTYFFSIGYSESLFFLLFVLSFYFASKNKLLNASLAGSLTFLSRTMGVILLPVLLLSSIMKRKQNLLKKISSIILIPTPFLITISIYLIINWSIFKDIFAFKAILENHWYKEFSPPWVSINNTLKLIITQKGNNSLMLGYFEGIPALLGIILIPIAIKKLKFPDWLYYVLAILFITSTNFLLSTPRYFLSIPPFFILLGSLAKKNAVFYPLALVSTAFLLYFSTLFVQGQWAF